MIEEKVDGVIEAEKYFNNLADRLGMYLTEATTESGYYLVDQIKAVTGETYELMTNESLKTTWVAPSPDKIKDEKLRGKSQSTWRYRKCPFWVDMIKGTPIEGLDGLSVNPEVENIATNALEEIRNITIKVLTRYLGY